ncbi:MAG: iron chaperone [Ktedonobacterales bacterium]
MDMNRAGFSSVDAYIATFPKDVQEILEALRATIRAAAPDATEKISYQMPTFAQNGNVVHFAARKHHIGFYPTPSGIEAFRPELMAYIATKGSVHFPLDQPLPMDLISRIVRFRVAENLARAATASRKRKA